MSGLEIVGIVLLIVGLVLVGVEMTIPGFGLPGISGIICIIAGIVMTAKTVSDGIVMVIIIIVILGVMLAVIMTMLGAQKTRAPIVLRDNVKGEHGFLNSSDLEYLVGREGITVTDLRPAGKGNFDGVDFDILSESRYILKGQKIRISKVRDNKLIVTEITD
uniref:NfeD family protein n=1 Tax=Acetatifactor sp. TaxID=1872090 RepID=UPI0040577BA0